MRRDLYQPNIITWMTELPLDSKHCSARYLWICLPFTLSLIKISVTIFKALQLDMMFTSKLLNWGTVKKIKFRRKKKKIQHDIPKFEQELDYAGKLLAQTTTNLSQFSLNIFFLVHLSFYLSLLKTVSKQSDSIIQVIPLPSRSGKDKRKGCLCSLLMKYQSCLAAVFLCHIRIYTDRIQTICWMENCAL